MEPNIIAFPEFNEDGTIRLDVIDRTKGVEPMIIQSRYCKVCGESIFKHTLAWNPDRGQFEPDPTKSCPGGC